MAVVASNLARAIAAETIRSKGVAREQAVRLIADMEGTDADHLAANCDALNAILDAAEDIVIRALHQVGAVGDADRELH